MKKIFFLLLSSFYFCILHAQEKAISFDPKNYLEQKKANTSSIYEWSLKNKVTDQHYKELLAPGFKITINGTAYKINGIAYSLPAGNKVITLLQGNMPCIVPNMSRFTMPVLKVEVPNTMPNAIGMSRKNRSEIIAEAIEKANEKNIITDFY